MGLKKKRSFLSGVVCPGHICVCQPATRFLSTERHRNRQTDHKRGICDITQPGFSNAEVFRKFTPKVHTPPFATRLIIECPLRSECSLRPLLALSASFVVPLRTSILQEATLTQKFSKFQDNSNPFIDDYFLAGHSNFRKKFFKKQGYRWPEWAKSIGEQCMHRHT